MQWKIRMTNPKDCKTRFSGPKRMRNYKWTSKSGPQIINWLKKIFFLVMCVLLFSSVHKNKRINSFLCYLIAWQADLANAIWLYKKTLSQQSSSLTLCGHFIQYEMSVLEKGGKLVGELFSLLFRHHPINQRPNWSTRKLKFDKIFSTFFIFCTFLHRNATVWCVCVCVCVWMARIEFTSNEREDERSSRQSSNLQQSWMSFSEI